MAPPLAPCRAALPALHHHSVHGHLSRNWCCCSRDSNLVHLRSHWCSRSSDSNRAQLRSEVSKVILGQITNYLANLTFMEGHSFFFRLSFPLPPPPSSPPPPSPPPPTSPPTIDLVCIVGESREIN